MGVKGDKPRVSPSQETGHHQKLTRVGSNPALLTEIRVKSN